MEASRGRFTLILLTDPGAPARQLQVPRAWPIFLGLFSALSIAGSLLVGRQARAWCEPEAEQPGIAVPFQEAVVERPRGRSPELQALATARTDGSELGARSRKRLALDAVELVSVNSAAARSPRSVQTAPRLPVELALPRPLLSGKQLSLFDVNSKNSLRVMPFDRDGVPDQDAFRQLRSFMRCRRSGHEADMDPRLIAVLSRISQHFGDAVVQIISGHRKPDGVVTRETSQHAFGTAADIRIPGVSIETLKDAAHELGARGVGVYPQSRFVHVDVRKKAYSWRAAGDEPETSVEAATDP